MGSLVNTDIRAGQEEYWRLAVMELGTPLGPVQKNDRKIAVLHTLHLGPGVKLAPVAK
jgi:hypothetical protein